MSRIVWVRYLDETEPPWDQGDVPWIVRILVRWAITIVAFLAAEWFVNVPRGRSILGSAPGSGS